MNKHNISRVYGYVLPFLILAGAVFVVYFSSINAPLVLDDIRTIVDNPVVHDLGSFAHPSILVSPRPLTDLTFALNYAVDGTNPAGYRLVNIFIHILNSYLVYLLVFFALTRIQSAFPEKPLEISRSTLTWMRSAALAGALIFALHPLQTMAVTYIAQRYTSLAAFFALACVGCYILARINYKKAFSGGVIAWIFFALALISAVLAFLSKQNAAMLPGLILLIEFTLFSRSRTQRRMILIPLIIFLVFFGAFILYNSGMIAGNAGQAGFLANFWQGLAETDDISRWEYLCTQFGVVVRYLFMVVFPAGLNIDHNYPFVSGFWDGLTPVYFLLLFLLLAFALFSIRRHPLVTLGIVWIFVSLSVESSIIPISDAMFEHRMYLPMSGVALLAGYLCFRVVTLLPRPGVILPVILIIACLFGATTFARNELWRDPEKLWADSVQKNPDNDRAWNNLGQTRLEKGKLEQAKKNFKQALEINEKNPRAKGNLGFIYFQLGNNEQALSLMQTAVKKLPRSTDHRYNLGVLYSAMGRSDKAIEQYERALDLRPEYHQARINMGIELARMGHTQEAATHLQKVLDDSGDHFDLLRNLGMLRLQLGELDRAKDLLNKALSISPESADVLTLLGIAEFHSGNYSKARDKFRTSINLDPGNLNARQYLQRTLQEIRKQNQDY